MYCMSTKQKTTYSIKEMHRSDWAYEDCSETSKASFNKHQIRAKKTCKHKTKRDYTALLQSAQKMYIYGGFWPWRSDGMIWQSNRDLMLFSVPMARLPRTTEHSVRNSRLEVFCWSRYSNLQAVKKKCTQKTIENQVNSS